MLYHGTSEKRWESIKAGGVIKVAPSGMKCVSTSPDKEVARYFADLAADTDDSSPVILLLDREALERADFELEEVVDTVWDTDEVQDACAWEQEVAIWQPVPLDFVRTAIVYCRKMVS